MDLNEQKVSVVTMHSVKDTYIQYMQQANLGFSQTLLSGKAVALVTKTITRTQALTLLDVYFTLFSSPVFDKKSFLMGRWICLLTAQLLFCT